MTKRYLITEKQYKEVLNHLTINESEMNDAKEVITEKVAEPKEKELKKVKKKA